MDVCFLRVLYMVRVLRRTVFYWIVLITLACSGSGFMMAYVSLVLGVAVLTHQ